MIRVYIVIHCYVLLVRLVLLWWWLVGTCSAGDGYNVGDVRLVNDDGILTESFGIAQVFMLGMIVAPSIMKRVELVHKVVLWLSGDISQASGHA